jgi:hypothetical protein
VKQILSLTFGLIALAATALPVRAEWGWPPPGYSAATGIRACDGSQYRGLCAVLRDWRHRGCPGDVPASPPPFTPGAGSLPAGPSGPAYPQSTPQPPTPGGGARP